MSVENQCELIAKTKELAIKKGLDPEKVGCPFINFCPEPDCYLVGKPLTVLKEEFEERFGKYIKERENDPH